MANPDPSRTEKPTAKKIGKARNEGRVLTSPDVSSFCMLLGGLMLFLITVPMLRDAFSDIMRLICNVDCRHNWDANSLSYGTQLASQFIAKVTLPFMFGISLLALLTMRLQVGKYFSIKALKWKFNSLKPNFKSILPNKDNLIKLLLTLGKVGLIGLVVYASIRQEFDNLFKLPFESIYNSIAWLLEKSFYIVLRVITLFAAIAVLDYIHKRKQYYDNLMMTKQEVKDERKNSEGDPVIKAKIRAKMKQLLMSQMMANLPKADVVITNPTHVAVAIQYQPSSFAPIVVAKGLRKRAQKIKNLAREYDIPIVEALPLARSLYRNTKIGQFIPEELFGAVAAILAELHKTGKRKFYL